MTTHAVSATGTSIPGANRDRGDGTLGIVMTPDFMEQERLVLEAYEKAVVACTEWVRTHYEPGTSDWKHAHGMLDCFVRYGINARARYLDQLAGSEPPPDQRQVRGDLHALEKLLTGAYNWAGAESREAFEPYVRLIEELTDGRGVGLLDRIRPRPSSRK